MNKKAKEWLEQAKKHYNTSNDKAALVAAIIALVEVLMGEEEEPVKFRVGQSEPNQDREMKTEYKDPLWKEENKKDDDQQQPQNQPE